MWMLGIEIHTLTTKPSCLPRLGPMRLLAVRIQALDTEPDKLGSSGHM